MFNYTRFERAIRQAHRHAQAADSLLSEAQHHLEAGNLAEAERLNTKAGKFNAKGQSACNRAERILPTL